LQNIYWGKGFWLLASSCWQLAASCWPFGIQKIFKNYILIVRR
jgi:hypothetical protein